MSTFDFAIVLNDFGTNNLISDLDGSGFVDHADLGIFLSVDEACNNPFGAGGVEILGFCVDNSNARAGDDQIHPEFDGGITHFTFDLVADASAGGDGWTCASINATLAGDIAFFQSGVGDDGPPPPNFIDFFPAVEFDSYYAASELASKFTRELVAQDDLISGTWGNHFGYVGTIGQRLQIARFTITDDAFPLRPVIRPLGAMPSPTQLGVVEVGYTTGNNAGTVLTTTFELLGNPLSSDANCDCVVDAADIGIIILAFGTDDPYADTNGDGIVDAADLGVLISEFMTACP